MLCRAATVQLLSAHSFAEAARSPGIQSFHPAPRLPRSYQITIKNEGPLTIKLMER